MQKIREEPHRGKKFCFSAEKNQEKVHLILKKFCVDTPKKETTGILLFFKSAFTICEKNVNIVL